jgi:hypothetical protein
LIEKEKGESRGRSENFAATPQDKIERALRDTDVPMLSGYGWTKRAAPGGRIDLMLFIANADAPNVFVHVWVGSGNIDPVVGTFLLNVDPRFPRLTRPEHPGLADFAGDPHPFPMQPGTKRLNFSLAIPSPIEESVYLGNICLMQCAGHGIGREVGRAVFPFAVGSAPP